MLDKKQVEEYFYAEINGYEISTIELAETKHSYFDTVDCYFITTMQGSNFYIFTGDSTLTNIYPIKNEQSLEECYYLHVGFIAEYASTALHQNFILNFIKDTTVFPILDRRMSEISADITLEMNASQLCGLANQIRECYIILSNYLMNKLRTHNSEFKDNDFKENLAEFIAIVLPGQQSETRRNTINSIAQKGWKFNSELVHKDSITVFDIMISFNILQLIVSTISNVIVGNNMPFNKIKCPYCRSERQTLQQDNKRKEYCYMCEDCGHTFAVALDDIIKTI